MNSKVTEKEFRQAFADRSGHNYQSMSATEAVNTAREAGLEFAPEPVKLPERLEIRASEPAPLLTPEGGFFRDFAERDATYALARDRYNAYPGLYAAASQLVRRTIGSTAAVPLDLLQALDAELAKGPVIAEVRLTREMVEEVDGALQRCVLRLQSSKAPESRLIGIETEETLLRLAEAVARYNKLVEIHGGEGRRPEYTEGAGDLLSFPTAGKES